MAFDHGPNGAFRRRIDLYRRGKGRVIGWVEDDFHHFGVCLDYEEGLVSGLQVAAERVPWATCPGAAVPLQLLVGQRLVARSSDVGRLIDMRLQCTHLFDLAGLLLAHAFHGRGRRSYEAVIADRAWEREGDGFRFGPGRAVVWRDEREAMVWDMDGTDIVGPAPYTGHSIQRGFREWTEGMDVETAEAATVLRRAVFVSGGRPRDLDRRASADTIGFDGVCHSYQPGVREQAFRIAGATRRFESAADMLGPQDRFA